MNLNPKKLGTVTNDDRADWTDAWRLFPGDVAYVWHGGLKVSIVEASLHRAGFTTRAQIVWAKDRLALSRAQPRAALTGASIQTAVSALDGCSGMLARLHD